jgi:hypothetical protein
MYNVNLWMTHIPDPAVCYGISGSLSKGSVKMPVYVDKARNPYGRMIMSHMGADSADELLEMADLIGLHRRHFQPRSHPHFDVSQAYRNKALAAGAIEVDRKRLVSIMRLYRSKLETDPVERRKLEQASSASDIGKVAS